MLMMTPPLLRYFWFHSIYSLAASCSLQSAVCGLQSAVCSLWSEVCSLRSAVCGLESAVCSLQSKVCKCHTPLEILDFQPKLLWRTPSKIHRERRRRRRQLTRSRAQSTENIASTRNMYRGSDKILQSHCKWSRWRERTPIADASKSDGEIRQRLQFTVKLSSSMQR